MLDGLRRIFNGPSSPAKVTERGTGNEAVSVDDQRVRADLLRWSEREFSEREQDHILDTYGRRVMAFGFESLTQKQQMEKIFRLVRMSALATFFISPKSELPLARRILDKALHLGEADHGPILERHLICHNFIRVFYADRTRDPAARDFAVEWCLKQIELAPLAREAFLKEHPYQALPAHTGFHQLAIIREKDKDYDDAIRLSKEATGQGWNGDWAKRIARCEKKLERLGRP